jgi:hypothetical protein
MQRNGPNAEYGQVLGNELKMFSDILEKCLLDPTCQIPLTVMARRFSEAI